MLEIATANRNSFVRARSYWGSKRPLDVGELPHRGNCYLVEHLALRGAAEYVNVVDDVSVRDVCRFPLITQKEATHLILNRPLKTQI